MTQAKSRRGALLLIVMCGVLTARAHPSVAQSGTGAGNTAATDIAARLMAGYPGLVTGVDGTTVTFADGTTLPLDDGKVWSPMIIVISPQTLVGP